MALRRKDPKIDESILDELLAGQDPAEVFRSGAILHALSAPTTLPPPPKRGCRWVSEHDATVRRADRVDAPWQPQT